MKQLPTNSDGLQMGTIDKTIKDIEDVYIPQIKLYKSQIPLPAKESFTLDEIIEWVEEAIKKMNKVAFYVKWAIIIWEKITGKTKEKTIEDLNTHEIKTIILNEALKRIPTK